MDGCDRDRQQLPKKGAWHHLEDYKYMLLWFPNNALNSAYKCQEYWSTIESVFITTKIGNIQMYVKLELINSLLLILSMPNSRIGRYLH